MRSQWRAVARATAMLLTVFVLATTAEVQEPRPAPVPRTTDGKPDLTGVYQASSRRGAWDFEVPGEQPGQSARATPVNSARPEPIPFRPEARQRAQEIVNRRSVDDPASLCLPQPSPRMTTVALFPIQFIQTPQQMVIMYEYFYEFRVIPTDGRKLPDDIEPAYLGNPVGRWEGDTFVVDMVGFKPGLWFGNGLVTSDALKITERFTRVDRDQINYEAVLEDPKVLTKPYTIRATLMLREGTRLREYSCVENNVDPQRYEKLLSNPATFTRTPPAP
jgi:hypothetical protein